MKAVILAGGQASRARPFSNYFPKAMIPINGKPMIYYVVNHLSKFKIISEIIILSNYEDKGYQIKNYLADYKTKKKIRFVQDSSLGTGGDLINLEKELRTDFLLWFVDNLSPLDVQNMYELYKKNKKNLGCIAVRKYRKEETGFAIVDEKNTITKFLEKPIVDLQMHECLGVYLLNNKILNTIRKELKKNGRKGINLSYDILQNISKQGNVSAYDIGNTYWIDVESPMRIDRNKSLIKKITNQMLH